MRREEDFKEFAEAPETPPPRALSERILFHVRTDLNPPLWRVSAKLAAIHLVVGTLTLFFCPQFGVHLGTGKGLLDVLMQYGDQACMLGCGALFMSGSALAAILFLRIEEIRAIRRTRLLLFPALGVFSLGLFVCAGGTVALSLALFWLLGSMAGGLATLELGWLFHSHTRFPAPR